MRTPLFIFIFLLQATTGYNQLYFNFLEYPDPIIFDDLDDFQNGVETSLLFEVGSNLNRSANLWDISLHATDDLRNGNQVIPVENIYIKVVNHTPGLRTPFHLSKSDRYLIRKGHIEQFRRPLRVLTNLKALGGNDFMKPAGVYSTTLIFTLVED